MTTNLPVKNFESGEANAAKHGAYYNGFYFPASSRFKKYSRPVYSSNGRMIKRRNPVISIEFDFFPEDYIGETWGANSAVVLNNVQQALEQPGRNFCIAEGAIGNFCVNSVKSTDKSVFPEAFRDLDDEDSGRMSYTKDLDGGPKPKITVYDPFPGGGTSGHSNAVKVVWEVELAINTCGLWPDASSSINTAWNIGSGVVLDVVSEVSYSINEGLSTRRIELEIEFTNFYMSESDLGLEKSLDVYAVNYANSIRVLPGHKRTVERRLRSDGKTINVSVVDTQIDSYSPYPVGVRNISLAVTHESELESGGLYAWEVNVEYHASVYPGVPKYYALAPFLAYINLQYARENALAKPGGFPGLRIPMIPERINQQNDPSPGVNIIRSIRLGPNDFYNTDFRAAIRWMSCFDLSKLVQIQGSLDPLLLNTWDVWNASTAKLHEGDGQLGIQQTRTHTDIQNLCGGDVSVFDTTISPKTVAAALAKIAQNVPPPSKSWLKCEASFEYYSHPNILQLNKAVRLPPPQDALNGQTNFDRAQQFPNGNAQQLPQEQRELLLKPVFQTTANEQHFVRFFGEMSRIGYSILVPKLATYQGANAAVYRTDKLMTKPVAEAVGGIPIYHAAWDVTYLLDRRPNGDHRFTSFASSVPTMYPDPKSP